MTPTVSIKIVTDLKEVKPEEDKSFFWGHLHFYTNHHAKTFLEKTFDMKLNACYVAGLTIYPKKDEMRWDNRHIVLFTEQGKIIELQNSEWACFKVH